MDSTLILQHTKELSRHARQMREAGRENADSIARSRYSGFSQIMKRYPPFMNRDVTKTDLFSSDEECVKYTALEVISEGSSCNTIRVGSWAYYMLQR